MTRPVALLARRTIFALVVAAAIAGCRPKAPPPPPPPDVLVTEVKQQDVPIYNEYVGQLDASVNATIQCTGAGLSHLAKLQGGPVGEEGDVLFEIDRRPFEAALAQAKAAFLQADASAKQAGDERATERRFVSAKSVERAGARQRHAKPPSPPARRRKRSRPRSNRPSSIWITPPSSRPSMASPGLPVAGRRPRQRRHRSHHRVEGRSDQGLLHRQRAAFLRVLAALRRSRKSGSRTRRSCDSNSSWPTARPIRTRANFRAPIIRSIVAHRLFAHRGRLSQSREFFAARPVCARARAVGDEAGRAARAATRGHGVAGHLPGRRGRSGQQGRTSGR